MNKVIISIIVPVYNVEKYLEQCVKSIISQTFTEWELLLINDGSPDKSGEMCDEYALLDNRIKVYHKKNGGVSSARNLGISKAKGRWITFVDSDDYLLPNFLKELYKPIERGEDLDFVQGGCTNSIGGRIIDINQIYDFYIGEEPQYLFMKFRGLTVSKLFLLDKIKKTQLYFDEKMKIAEDMAFTLDYIYTVNRYAFVSETGYCYRIDNMSSATKSKTLPSYEIELHSFRHLYLSTMKYIERYKLSEMESMLRLMQRGKQLANVCTLLYMNGTSRKLRIQHLKDDFELKQLELLKYMSSNKFNKFIFSLLARQYYNVFDCIMFLVYKLKYFFEK